MSFELKRITDIPQSYVQKDDVKVFVNNGGEFKQVDIDLVRGETGDPILYVNVTEAADGTLSADKTLDEIKAAYARNQDVMMRTDAGAQLPLFMCDLSSASFMFTYATESATTTTTYTITKTKVAKSTQTTTGGSGDSDSCIKNIVDGDRDSIIGIGCNVDQEAGSCAVAFGEGCVSTGEKAFSAGESCSASGSSAIAVGYGTKAIGYAAAAFGRSTQANGDYSFACGYQVYADGFGAYAEGKSCQANGDYSHAEGQNNIAAGQCSHSEGKETKSSGGQSHAEGYVTESSGQYSHAEGGQTIASDNGAHAEGYQTIASGHSAHAEGWSTSALGTSSHCEGGGMSRAIYVTGEANSTTYVVRNEYIAQGHRISTPTYLKTVQVVSSTYSFDGSTPVSTIITSETLSDVALSDEYMLWSGCSALGSGSHAEGIWTSAHGTGAHAEGITSCAFGAESHAEGWRTYAGICAHAEGYNTIAEITGSHAEGTGTHAVSSDQHVEGRYNALATGYLHVAGNGRDPDHRSNAYTLDWSGNGVYAGIVKAKGIILTSPDGSEFLIKVNNDGTLVATKQ